MDREPLGEEDTVDKTGLPLAGRAGAGCGLLAGDLTMLCLGEALMSTVVRCLVLLTGLLTSLGACVPVVIGEGSPPFVVTGGPRAVHIPPGHYPPPGHCRLWYPDRPPGHQPPPVRCEQLVAGPGGFILYNGKAWDADYNWQAYARQHPGAVPRIILELTTKR